MTDRRDTSRPPGCGAVAPAVLGLLALAISALACGGSPPAPSPTARVLKERIERIVVATGTIEPVKEVEVRPRIPGIVDRIHVKAGDAVTAGMLLVELERDLLESQVAEARAALREAQIEQHYAEIDLERARELRENGAHSAQELDQAKAQAERAGARVARAQAVLRTLETELGYATVRSSLDGRVLDVPAEEGSAVSPVTAVTGGTLLLTLAATDRLHLEGLVDENEVARVEVGQTARIRTEAFGNRIFEGRVREVAPVGKRIQNVTYFEVKIDVVDPDASLLRPRMSGDADIVTQVIDDAITIPETGLRYRGDEVYVALPSGDGPPSERPVKVGIVDGTRVQLLEGASEGEEVLLQ